jgi:retron-type reverse transcriptase
MRSRSGSGSGGSTGYSIATFNFDRVDQKWLVRFVEHRIGDRRIIRLIGKWLTAGVLEDGHLIETEEGTPQGAVISPLLANIYLHHVYDQWVHQWRQRYAAS